MIPISIVYTGFLLIVLVIVYYSIKNINSFFEDITYGGGLEQKHYKYVVFIHIGIVIYSIFILLLFNYNKTTLEHLSLKPFIINIFISSIGLFIIYIVFHIQKYYVQKYLRNFYIDAYKDLQEDDDSLNLESEYDERSISIRYNKIISGIVLQIFFVYLLMFLFPVTGMEEMVVPDSPASRHSVSQNIVDAARQRYGANYLIELAKIKRNYIERHGLEQWNEYFEWQLQGHDITLAEQQLEMERLEDEISNISREIERESERGSEPDNLIELFDELYEPVDLSTLFQFDESEYEVSEEDILEQNNEIDVQIEDENPFRRLYTE